MAIHSNRFTVSGKIQNTCTKNQKFSLTNNKLTYLIVVNFNIDFITKTFLNLSLKVFCLFLKFKFKFYYCYEIKLFDFIM